ncbi:hypothetical protein F2Q70_00016240 [Brassica cretica]|uniref:Uncharacterized protein n=1 Tax=Brassica cretica TaxID=69181 RepID=A0A8S9HQY4_BRACR|nr:hypothetical protein F2Q70_00016240 [Brassica cretica]KAF2598630.1 hypothetical protein F2Q68_00009226 [Brassica cretica]
MPPPKKLVSRWRLGLEFDLARKRRRTETHQPKKLSRVRDKLKPIGYDTVAQSRLGQGEEEEVKHE